MHGAEAMDVWDNGNEHRTHETMDVWGNGHMDIWAYEIMDYGKMDV